MRAAQSSIRVGKRVASGSVSPFKETFAAVSRRYLKHQKKLLSPSSFKREDRIIALHLTPFFGENTKLAAVRELDVHEYVKRRSSVVSLASIIKELQVLKHLFSLAVKWKLLPVSPAKDIKGPPTPAFKVSFLEPSELRSVLEHCPEWLRPIVHIAVATGMRRGEILSLRWLDVDLKCGRITLPPTKKKQQRVIPLNDWAQQVLASVYHEESKPTKPVFSGDSVTPSNVSQAFLRACKSANVGSFSFRDLRQTSAVWMLELGVDIGSVSAFLGHSDLRMVAKYQHRSTASLSDAVNLLDRAFVEDDPKAARTSSRNR